MASWTKNPTEGYARLLNGSSGYLIYNWVRSRDGSGMLWINHVGSFGDTNDIPYSHFWLYHDTTGTVLLIDPIVFSLSKEV
jgi:hypothetical protein